MCNMPPVGTTPIMPTIITAAPAATGGGGAVTIPPLADSPYQSALVQLSQAVQAISALISAQTGATGGGAVKQAYVGQTGVQQTTPVQGGGAGAIAVIRGDDLQRLSIPATGSYEMRVINGVSKYFDKTGGEITAFQYADANPVANAEQQRIRLINSVINDARSTGSLNPVDIQKLQFEHQISADEQQAIFAGNLLPEPYTATIPATGRYENVVIRGANHFFDQRGAEISAAQYTAAMGRTA